MQRGMLIAVEGPDKSGKETLTDLLAKEMILDGYEVVSMDFPDDSSPTGEKIREILSGYHPLDAKINAMELQALMAVNRYESQARIETALMRGKVVICDRYIGSGLVYGAVGGVDAQWLKSIHHSLIQPDLTLVLDIDLGTYRERCKNYEYLDEFEQNEQFIANVMEAYRAFAEAEEWVTMDGKQAPEDLARQAKAEVDRLIETGEY